AENGGDVVVAFHVGLLREIQVAAVRLRFAGERGLEVLFSAAALQVAHDAPRGWNESPRPWRWIPNLAPRPAAVKSKKAIAAIARPYRPRACSAMEVAARFGLVADADDAQHELAPARHRPLDRLAHAQAEDRAADRREHRYRARAAGGAARV